MNAPAKIAARHIASEIGKPQNAERIARQMDMNLHARRLRDQFAVRWYGADPAKPLAPVPAGASLAFAESVAGNCLTDAERVDLMFYLLDSISFDAPDLRTEAESILNEIGAHVRGEA